MKIALDISAYTRGLVGIKEYIANLMSVLIKLDDSIFGETEKIISKIKKSRNRYINEALDFYNRFQKRLILEKKLKKESDLVKSDSIKVLQEFENIDYAD